MTCIEQEVVRERAEGQPAVKGEQRICFTDKKIRNEVRFGEKCSVALLDLDAGRIVLIPGQEPEYVELPIEVYRRLVALRLKGSGLNDPEVEPSLTSTQEIRQIGDWKCRKLIFEQTGRMQIHAELWVAQDAKIDFSAWLTLMDRLGLLGAVGRIGRVARQIEGLPIELRVEQAITDQKLVTTTRVERITTEPLDAGTFQIPAGYERVEAGPFPGLAEPAQPAESSAAQGG